MLLQIDGTLIFVFISFTIFVFLMNIICYKPIVRIIEERNKFLEKNKNSVLEAENKRDEIIKAVNSELSGAKLESSKMLQSASIQNKKEKEEVINNKKNEISCEINEFEQNLNQDSARVKLEIKDELEGYVKLTVSKVLNINPDSITLNKEKLDGVLK